MTHIAEWEILDLLTALVEKSLVVYEEDEHGVGRYRLLETVRQYAGDRLDEVDERDVAPLRDRHRDFFLAFAEEAEPRLRGVEQVMWLERLETEHKNLRAALEWSQQTSPYSPPCRGGEGEGAGLGLRLAGALWHFWEVRGYFAEGREWLEGMLERGSSAAAAWRAKAFTGAGTMAWLQGDYARAVTLHEKALALYRAVGDKGGIAFALNNLGTQALARGDYARARTLFEESLALHRELGDRRGVSFVLNNLGEVARGQGDYARARVLYEEGLDLSRELEDRYLLAILLYNLGMVSWSQGDGTAARPLWEECLMTAIRLGDKRGIALSLEALAGVWGAQGQPQRAARLLGAAEVLREAINAPVEPTDRAEYERNVTAVRATLGDEAFAEAWAEGRAMPLEDAVAYALGEK